MPIATTAAATEVATGTQNSNTAVPVVAQPGVASSTTTTTTVQQPATKEKKHNKIKLDIAPLKMSLKKTTLDINKWNDRKLEQDTDTSTSKSSVTSSTIGGGDNALLMQLGLDYATLGCLRVRPVGETTGEGGPICDGSGEKWACLVSRRCFATEEQLAKHIRLSKLYKEELTKAVNEGRVIRLT